MSVRAQLSGASVQLGSVQALDCVDLTVEPGQFLALLGPSGSGKTTTLNVFAGFVTPDSGTVTFDGNDVTNVAPYRRDLGIVFQSYALFPHMTVADNVAFPLRMRKMERTERSRKVAEALQLVGLAEQAGRSVTTLSGGQRQRVALARAVVFEPRLMLLDEPLAALDKQLRDQMQLEIRSLQRRIGITTIAVTHDQIEALTMADVVAVMNDGHIEQVAPPEELYLRPATLFVATFLGEANLLSVHNGELEGFGRLGTAASGKAVVRPEHLKIDGSEDDLQAQGTVEDVTFQGARLRTRVRLASAPDVALTVAQPSGIQHAISPGTAVRLSVDPRMVHVIAA